LWQFAGHATFDQMRHLILAGAAILAIATGLSQLNSATHGLTIVHQRVGTIPVTVFKPAPGAPAPAVVIAHGFAGSQQLMQPFAVTLARNGYVALTFDFPGHARNSTPLPGGLADHDARTKSLLAAVDTVVMFARNLPESDGRLALLGHSMASDIVVRYAQRHPAVEATVGVSLYSPGVTAGSPRNLLVIDGAWEPAMLRDEAYRIVSMAANGPAQERVTYGKFADGSARRLALADGVEHIAVLYSKESMAETLGWLNQAFGRRSTSGFLDARGLWLGLLYLGLVALAHPLAKLLPQVASTPQGIGYRWRQLLPIAIAPALLTPLMLWKLPSDFLPILLGDYLALHFGLYGLLTATGIWMLQRTRIKNIPSTSSSWRPFVIAILATAGYGIFAIGLPLDWFVFSFLPGPKRFLLILAMLAGTLAYFGADEWLTRGATAPRAGYAVTKLFFLLSLVLAIALNLEKLFFLIIIVPAILAFFVVYGLFSTWAYRRTNHPWVGAIANGTAFAWAIGVTFPLVG
jgi:dienelactone hydrolase